MKPKYVKYTPSSIHSSIPTVLALDSDHTADIPTLWAIMNSLEDHRFLSEAVRNAQHGHSTFVLVNVSSKTEY